MSDVVNVFNGISNLDVSPQFDSYSKVIIHVNDETVIEVGNDTGRTLEIDNPFCTQEMAQAILESLQRTGTSTGTAYQYQPYDAQGTILNPAAEIGDALSATNIFGGIYTRSRNFGRLMKADVSAPQDEEINHEYKYESAQEREFKRETSEIRATLSLTSEAISSEVIRATDAENTLSSRIQQTADAISATVSSTGGDNSTFGWDLNATSWTLKSNGQDVFKADASGVEVNGKITATSGKIGGFNIAQTAIYNGTGSLSANVKGVYVGTDGIRVCGDLINGTRNSFTANSSGSVVMTGTLTIGNSTITADTLRSGAQSAYTNGSTWSTGSGYGYAYNNATKLSNGSYPSFFKAYRVDSEDIRTSSLMTDGYFATWKNVAVSTPGGGSININYLGR